MRDSAIGRLLASITFSLIRCILDGFLATPHLHDPAYRYVAASTLSIQTLSISISFLCYWVSLLPIARDKLDTLAIVSIIISMLSNSFVSLLCSIPLLDKYVIVRSADPLTIFLLTSISASVLCILPFILASFSIYIIGFLAAGRLDATILCQIITSQAVALFIGCSLHTRVLDSCAFIIQAERHPKMSVTILPYYHQLRNRALYALIDFFEYEETNHLTLSYKAIMQRRRQTTTRFVDRGSGVFLRQADNYQQLQHGSNDRRVRSYSRPNVDDIDNHQTMRDYNHASRTLGRSLLWQQQQPKTHNEETCSRLTEAFASLREMQSFSRANRSFSQTSLALPLNTQEREEQETYRRPIKIANVRGDEKIGYNRREFSEESISLPEEVTFQRNRSFSTMSIRRCLITSGELRSRTNFFLELDRDTLSDGRSAKTYPNEPGLSSLYSQAESLATTSSKFASDVPGLCLDGNSASTYDSSHISPSSSEELDNPHADPFIRGGLCLTLLDELMYQQLKNDIFRYRKRNILGSPDVNWLKSHLRRGKLDLLLRKKNLGLFPLANKRRLPLRPSEESERPLDVDVEAAGFNKVPTEPMNSRTRLTILYKKAVRPIKASEMGKNIDDIEDFLAVRLPSKQRTHSFIWSAPKYPPKEGGKIQHMQTRASSSRREHRRSMIFEFFILLWTSLRRRIRADIFLLRYGQWTASPLMPLMDSKCWYTFASYLHERWYQDWYSELSVPSLTRNALISYITSISVLVFILPDLWIHQAALEPTIRAPYVKATLGYCIYHAMTHTLFVIARILMARRLKKEALIGTSPFSQVYRVRIFEFFHLVFGYSGFLVSMYQVLWYRKEVSAIICPQLQLWLGWGLVSTSLPLVIPIYCGLFVTIVGLLELWIMASHDTVTFKIFVTSIVGELLIILYVIHARAFELHMRRIFVVTTLPALMQVHELGSGEVLNALAFADQQLDLLSAMDKRLADMMAQTSADPFEAQLYH